MGDGGNSGFQALNLAIQFRATRVVLVGFDMNLDRGVHWFGRHPQGLNNPTAENCLQWRLRLDGVAESIKALGVKVLNCSPVSALENYPKMSLAEALEC